MNHSETKYSFHQWLLPPSSWRTFPSLSWVSSYYWAGVFACVCNWSVRCSFHLIVSLGDSLCLHLHVSSCLFGGFMAFKFSRIYGYTFVDFPQWAVTSNLHSLPSLSFVRLFLLSIAHWSDVSMPLAPNSLALNSMTPSSRNGSKPAHLTPIPHLLPHLLPDFCYRNMYLPSVLYP